VNGSAESEALAAEIYDIVFSDVNFKDGTFHQVLAEVHGKYYDLPVVVVKGKPSIEKSMRLLG